MQRSGRHDRATLNRRVEHVCSPGISDVNLFRYCKRVINFDAQIANGAFDLGVAEQWTARILPVRRYISVALVRRSEWVPKRLESNPMLAIHSATSRAYCLVVMPWLPARRPANSE
jgi:hypothetical protein